MECSKLVGQMIILNVLQQSYKISSIEVIILFAMEMLLFASQSLVD